MIIPDSPPTSEPSHSDSFLALARYASALSCSIASGFLYSLKRVNPSLKLELSFGTLLACILGGMLTLWMWRLVQELAGRRAALLSGSEKQRRWVAVLGIGILLFGGMGLCYVMALKDVRSSALLQVMQGVGLALLVLSAIGVVMIRLVRLLNRDNPPEGSTGEEDSRGDDTNTP